jgi:hypothetical protein
MKRIMVASFFFLGLALLAAPCVPAQSGFFAQPSTIVRVVNNTNDGSVIGVEIGGSSSTSLIPYGGYFQTSYSDAGYGIGSASVPYTITACPADHTISVPAANDVPGWATNTSIFGDAAITADYLRGNPSQRDLEERVKAIIGILNAHDELGRKETKIKPLENWLKHVKKLGLREIRQACDSSSKWTGVLPGTIDITSYYNWRVIIIEITDGHPNYHSAIIRGQ